MRIEEIISLLGVRGQRQQELFHRARAVRSLHFGDRAVVRGVIEISDRCRADCAYCPMRRENHSEGYVMTAEQIVAAAEAIRQAGIGVVFLQGGETPETTEPVCKAIPEIKKLFGGSVSILLCLGEKTPHDLARFKSCGADGYILKHETSDPVLFRSLRNRNLRDRLACLRDLLALGYEVGTGNIVGLPGQSIESIARDVLLSKQIGAHMTSCSPFIPARNTPLEGLKAGDADLALNTMALMRIVNPKALIPSVSALEKLMTGGQVTGFNAGANVITANFTPDREKSAYRIYGDERFCVSRNHAFKTLERAGLSCHSAECCTFDSPVTPIRISTTF